MPPSSTGRSLAEVPSAGGTDNGISGSTTTSAARCSARRRSCSASRRGGGPRPSRHPSAPLPAADSGRAGLARRPGLPHFAPAPVLCPASARGQAVFHQGQPAQSSLSAAVETVGCSESLPVTIRPDEVSEALKVGVNELLSLYGIH